ncbi:MAG TPA: hypothetical protein PKZ84_22090 [Anaerolineae bacterium]|nr:hypothetical protein [Anaerolineae bacterium]
MLKFIVCAYGWIVKDTLKSNTFQDGGDFYRRERRVRRVAKHFSALSANSAVKSEVYLAFAPKLKRPPEIVSRKRQQLTSRQPEA